MSEVKIYEPGYQMNIAIFWVGTIKPTDTLSIKKQYADNENKKGKKRVEKG